MSDRVGKFPSPTIREAVADVHRRNGTFPANAIVFNVEMQEIMGSFCLGRLRPVGRIRKVFEVTIPDAYCLGILDHRQFVFVSEHVPPDQALVFNTGFEAEGHPERKSDDTKVYCLVDHTPVRSCFAQPKKEDILPRPFGA